MKPHFYIYVAFRLDGSPCYVGKGKGHRWRAHLWRSHNRQLRGIVSRSGGDIPIVIVRNGLTEQQAFECEVAFIAAIGRYPNGPLVNHTDGGEGTTGHKQSANTIEKRVSKLRGIPRPAEVVAGIALANLGKVRTDEVKEKLRGPKSLEHRKKLSDAKKGRKQHPDHVEARAAAQRGKKKPPEFCAKVTAGLIAEIFASSNPVFQSIQSCESF